MNIVGISCFYHDSAACLIKDGQIVAAAQEERFTRKKHDFRFPSLALAFCLKQGGLTIADIDYICFYDKPFLKFERILETYLAYAPKGFQSYLMAIPLWIKEKLWMSEVIKKECGVGFKGELLFTQHHQSHAASAFFPSPFQEAAILTVDGVGEWATTTIGIGKDNHINLQYELTFPHSLGLLYSAFTYYTGFKVNSAEYKVMGLAPYGEPIYAGRIYDYLIDLKEDGSFKLNMEYFNYCAGLTMTNEKFHDLFGGLPRVPESFVTQRDMDLAASVQVVVDEIMRRMARHVRAVTGKKNLCLAGGVALNCVANGKIMQKQIFEKMWIQPAAGDAGGALGAALFVWYDYLGNTRKTDGIHDAQAGSLLGPGYNKNETEIFLKENSISFSHYTDEQLWDHIADLLIAGKVIGWFSGRMEYGPRALGSRSILGDARSAQMQSLINLKIKFRESFRPFAPTILREYAQDYFEMDQESPYMLLVAPVQKNHCSKVDDTQEKLFGIDKLNVKRSDIPAVTHVDYSARVQTLAQDVNPRYYQLIKKFYEKTGCPVIINTSFNVRGEPIVCTLQDAYRCFMRTHMDCLVLGNYVLYKEQQSQKAKQEAQQEVFALD